MAERLEKRAFKTYKARLMTHERLRARGVAWNAFMISSATATTIASVAMLSEPKLYGTRGDVLLAILAIISLVASLVVANMNYGARTQAVESNYKRIQQISLSAEMLATQGCTIQQVQVLQREYEIALESSENHSEADYQRTLYFPTARMKIFRDSLASWVPYLMLVAAAVVAAPVAIWLARG